MVYGNFESGKNRPSTEKTKSGNTPERTSPGRPSFSATTDTFSTLKLSRTLLVQNSFFPEQKFFPTLNRIELSRILPSRTSPFTGWRSETFIFGEGGGGHIFGDKMCFFFFYSKLCFQNDFTFPCNKF